MKKIIGITALIILIGLSSCNKTKTTAKRFMKAGKWEVSELSVDATNEDELPTWEIGDCDIYKESCFGKWENEEGGQTNFVWQFSEKANTFEISHQIIGEVDEEDHPFQDVADQAYKFSGVYNVEKRKKDNMIFTSSQTVGFPNQNVKIEIKKK